MTTAIYETEFPSDLRKMPEVIRDALGKLAERGWIPAENQFELHLCLEEALVNAINHGNQGDPGLQVRIRIEEEGDTCCISVQDEGSGFQPACVPEPDLNTEGGRGICLIQHFMDSVHYDPEAQCLEMHFRKKS